MRRIVGLSADSDLVSAGLFLGLGPMIAERKWE